MYFIPTSDIWFFLLVYTAGVVASYLICSLFFKKDLYAALLVFLLSFFFFFWAAYRDFILQILPTGNIILGHVLSVIFIPALIIMAFQLYKRLFRRNKGSINRFLNSFMILSIVAELVLIIYLSWKKPEKNVKENDLLTYWSQSRSASIPDIYFIVLDEFGSLDALKKNLHYPTNELRSFLEDQKFRICDNSRSNYTGTIFSIASTFQMDYCLYHNEQSVSDINNAAALMYENRFSELLRNKGYKIVNYSPFNIKGAENRNYSTPHMLPLGSKLITHNTFYDQVIKKLNVILEPDFKVSFSEYYVANYFKYNEAVVADLAKYACAHKIQPCFLYAHIFSPHVPYYFDKAGNRLSLIETDKISEQWNAEYYTYNLKFYAVPKLCEMVTAIKSNDPSAVIIILGDHGTRHIVYDKDKESARFDNLYALFLPEGNYQAFPDTSVNVNLFRSLLNTYFQPEAPLLPSRFYK